MPEFSVGSVDGRPGHLSVPESLSHIRRVRSLEVDNDRNRAGCALKSEGGEGNRRGLGHPGGFLDGTACQARIGAQLLICRPRPRLWIYSPERIAAATQNPENHVSAEA